MWVSKPLGRGNHFPHNLHWCILFFLGAPLAGVELDERPEGPIPMGKEESLGAESESEVECDALLWLDALREGLS